MAATRDVILFLLPLFAFSFSEAAVILTKDNSSVVFESADASFTPKVPSAGICGVLFTANPIDACSALSNNFTDLDDYMCAQFGVLLRGGCSFDTKVRHAQDAGFQAVLIANNVESTELVKMAGNKRGISIPAVFISKVAGDVLFEYTNGSNADVWILPSYENIAWLVMVISFIILIGITTVFAICFLLRQHRRNRMQFRRLKEFNGISYQAVKSMPSIIYQSKNDGIGSYDVCAVCLEDYIDGAMLRILPCNHRFHCSCIDAWLINWRAFCPICKQDVIIEASSRPTECTPLLRSRNNTQPQALPGPGPFSEDDMPPTVLQENSVRVGIPPAPRRPPPADESCRFSFHGASMHAPRLPLRPMSLNSLIDQDSVEAFRASRFFMPPSSFRSSAPNVLAPSGSSSGVSPEMIITNCGSYPSSSSFESPQSAGETHLR